MPEYHSVQKACVRKKFNINGLCVPEEHYMVDISQRLADIGLMIENGDYFTINRGRQYGKTTTIALLEKYLFKRYTVFSISFQGVSDDDFKSSTSFYRMFMGFLYDAIEYGQTEGISETGKQLLARMSGSDSGEIGIREISNAITCLCKESRKPIVLIIDEVDQASNQSLFLAFLGMLREKYLRRRDVPTFQSVILAGVYDVRNIKREKSPWNTHAGNEENGSLLTFDDCPWDYRELVPYNIAAEFNVDMNLTVQGIIGMLKDYEHDHNTGMNVAEISQLIYDYTSGYPYLVSRICKIIDEQLPLKLPETVNYWTKEGVVEAVKIILAEQNTLFDDMRKKLADFPELRNMFYEMLYNGKEYPYNYYQPATDMAKMFGYITDNHGKIAIANRIFETWLYNLFVAEESFGSDIYSAGAADKNRFIKDGYLDMERVLERFIVHYTDLYGDRDDSFCEKEGRKYFLFYLKPIINGTGNYYVEAQTRDEKRTDVIIDYLGKQEVVEMKIWHGGEYNQRGEKQLVDYLEAYHLQKGYMLSFNFNKKKKVGIHKISVNGKTIVEAVV